MDRARAITKASLQRHSVERPDEILYIDGVLINGAKISKNCTASDYLDVCIATNCTSRDDLTFITRLVYTQYTNASSKMAARNKYLLKELKRRDSVISAMSVKEDRLKRKLAYMERKTRRLEAMIQ